MTEKSSENELPFGAVVNQMTAFGVARADLSGRFVTVNERFCEIAGRARAEMLGLKFHDNTHPDDAPQFLELFRRCVNEGAPFTLENRCLRSDGSELWVRSHVSLLRDAGGAPHSALIIVADATGEKLVQSALLESESRYRALTSASAQIILTIDAKNAGEFPAEWLAKLTDLDVEQLRGGRYLDLIHPDDREYVRKVSARTARRPAPYEIEFRLRRTESGDDYRYYNLRAVPVFTGQGEGAAAAPREWIAAVTDVTERRRAKEISARYRQLSLRGRDIILFVRADDGRIVEANQAAVDAYGYDRATLLGGMRIHDLRAPETVHLLDEQMRKASASGIQFETVHRRRDDTRFYVEVSSISADFGEEPLLISIVRDISERKEIEEHLLESQAMLALTMRSSRMGTWSREAATGEVFWSDELEEIFGLRRGAFGRSETSFYELVHEDDRERVWSEIELAVAARRDYAVEFRFYHADGSTRWMEERGQAVYSEKGAPVRLYGVGIDITERKQAEKKLRETNAVLTAINLNTPTLIYVKDRDSRILSANPATVAVLGRPLAEIVGKLPAEYMRDADEAEIIRANDLRIIEGGRTETFEEIVQTPAGTRIFLSTKTPYRHDGGQTIGLIGVSVDITERKRAEEKLLEAQNRLESSLTGANLGIWTFNVETGEFWADARAKRMHGYDADEVLTFEKAGANLHPEDRARSEAALARAIENRSKLQIENRVLKSGDDGDGDGFVRWIASYAEFVPSKDANAGIFYGIVQDITERKQADERRRESEERFRNIADAAPVLIWIADTSKKCTWFNKPWLDFTGRTLEQETDYGWAEGVHSEDFDRCLEIYSSSFDARKSFSMEYRLRRRDGEYRWLIDEGVPRFSPDGEFLGYIGSCVDITERKQAENRLALLGEISELTRKFDDAGELLFAVSRTVGEHLAVKRCLFNEIDLENDLEIVHRDYCRGVESVAGAHKISDYSSITTAEMTSGKIVFNHDSKIDRRTAADYEKIYEPNGERAYVAVPLMREGRWVASLWASDDKPRRWSDQEVSLLETIAERVWSVVEKLRIDAALRESEERLRLATEAARIYSWEYDAATAQTEYSPNAAAVLGFELPESVEETNRLIHTDDRERVLADFAAGLRGDRPLWSEFRFVHPATGEIVWVSSQGTLVRDAQGRPARVVGITQNVNERKRAAEKLETANYRFRVAEEAAKGFNYEWNLETNQVTRSESIERVVGYRRDELEMTWQAWADLIHPDDRIAQTEAEGVEFVSSLKEDSFGSEYRIRHKNGHYVWVLERCLVIRGDAGKVSRVIGQTIDVTERRLAEERLRESEEKYRTLFDSVDTGFCIVEMIFGDDGQKPLDYRFLEINPTFAGQTGLENAIGKTAREMVPDLEEFWFETYGRVARTGEAVRFENQSATMNRWFDVYALRVGGANSRRVGILFTDITERRRRESNLAFLADIAQDFSRLSTADEIMRTVGAKVGAYLNVESCNLCDVDESRGEITVGFNWNAAGGPDGLQTFRISDYLTEEFNQTTRAGEIFVVADAGTDSRTDARAFAALEIGAFVAVPFLRNGERKYIFSVTGAEPRSWRREEIELIQEISNRIFPRIERARAEKALRESEERFRNMADNAPVMIWVTDASGYCNYLSKSWFEFTGQTPAEAFGIGWTNALHPDDRKLAEEVFLSANEKRAPFRVEYRFRRADGEYRWAIDSAQPRFGADGEYLGYVGSVIDIHERRAAEEKIRENESALRAYYNSSPLMMGIVELTSGEADVLHVYDNPATCAFFGVENDSTAGRRASELGAAPEVMTRWIKHYRKSQRLNRPVNFEYEQKTGGGSDGGETRWLSVTVSFIGTVGGDAAVGSGGNEQAARSRFAYVAEDTTERKSAERQIRYQLDLTQTITDNTQSCLMMMDADGRCTFANYATERVTGFKPEELLGEILHEKIHHTRPDGTPFPKNECPLDKALPVQQTVVGFEDVFVHKNGHFFPVRCNARPIYKDGVPVGTVIEAQDITEEKRSREALIKAERRAAEEYETLLQRIVPLGQTLGTARDLISIYRAVFEFVRSSMSCSAFFVSFYDAEKGLRTGAYAWGEGAEVDVEDLPPMPITPDGGPNSQAIFGKKTVVTNRYMDAMRDRPHVVLQDDGRDPQSSLVAPMILKNAVLGTLEVQAHENEAFTGEHAVALEMVANLAAVAIENVRLLEVEANARRLAEEANRAKDEFLSVLSHELRTPLNSMFGWTRMLKSGILDEAKTKQAIDVIERNVRLQNNLIEDMLDVSRIITGKMRIEKEETDFKKIVEAAVEAARPAADQKNLTLAFDADAESYPLSGDDVRLQQVVGNLINNAVKFTPEGGAVTLDLTQAADGAAVLLNVADTGIGIEPEFLPRIFDRFRQADSTTKRMHSGLGLGLTIVRHLSELHGGRVHAASEGLGQGSTFTVELPLLRSSHSAVSNDGDPAAAALNLTAAAAGGGENGFSLRGARILLVDDDRDAMLPLQIILESHAAEVRCAGSVREAQAELVGAKFDLLVSDIGMPERDGYDLITTLRQMDDSANRDIPAIALTAYASTQDRRRALMCGFQHHFAKPLDFEPFLAVVKTLIAGAIEN